MSTGRPSSRTGARPRSCPWVSPTCWRRTGCLSRRWHDGRRTVPPPGGDSAQELGAGPFDRGNAGRLGHLRPGMGGGGGYKRSRVLGGAASTKRSHHASSVPIPAWCGTVHAGAARGAPAGDCGGAGAGRHPPGAAAAVQGACGVRGAAAVESLTTYIQEAKRETRRARQEPLTPDSLVRRHLGLPVVLATEIARKANLHRQWLPDLIAAGNVALVEASKKYDPSKGTFRAYAKPRVAGAILSALTMMMS